MTDLMPPAPVTRDEALLARVVIAVPALNEAPFIEACLASLIRGAEGVPILVLDGGSTDGTQKVINAMSDRHPQVSLVENPYRRQAAAINLAARIAPPGRDILVRADAHAVYPDGFALNLARRLDGTGADSVVVAMDSHPGPDAGPFARALAFIVDTPLGSGGSAHRGGRQSGWVDHGHHAAFRKGRFIALGGYDTTLVANEDAEYDTRLDREGGRIWLDAQIRVQYFVRRSAGALFNQYHRYGLGRAIHLRRHRRMPKLRQLLPAGHTALFLGCAAAAPFTPAALAYPFFYAATVIMAGVWAGTRTDLAAAFRVPLVLAILHGSWGSGFLRGLITPVSEAPA